jgi:hypothetical protein
MRKSSILLPLIVATPFIVGPYISVAAANHPDAPPLASVTGSVGTASTGAQVSRLGVTVEVPITDEAYIVVPSTLATPFIVRMPPQRKPRSG